MKKLIIGCMLLSSVAQAEPFVEVGIGAVIDPYHWGCIKDGTGCSDNPVGSIAVGYEYKGFSIQLDHTSSLVEKDYGLNTISVKYRYTWR